MSENFLFLFPFVIGIFCVDIFANSDNCVASFLKCMHFVYFSCLIALATTSRLSRISIVSGHPPLLPDRSDCLVSSWNASTVPRSKWLLFLSLPLLLLLPLSLKGFGQTGQSAVNTHSLSWTEFLYCITSLVIG